MLAQPRGFTAPLPCETGAAPGTTLGRLVNERGVIEFFYVREILRLAQDSGAYTLRGAWTIQIMSSAEENARVLFDQSVDMGITVFDNGFESGWFFVSDFGMGPGKFKTRFINARPVNNLIEPDAPAGPNTSHIPALLELKVQQIKARLPQMDTGMLVQLEASASRTGPWVNAGAGYPGEDIVVPAALVGAASPLDVWLRVQSGGLVGPAVRDAYVELAGSTQLAGYEGWRHINGGGGQPTVFWETPLSTEQENQGGILNNQIRGRWQSPIYRCSVPTGAVLRVESDYWATNTVISNRHTFAFGFKYGTDGAMLHSPKTGETWAWYPALDRQGMACARDTVIGRPITLRESDPQLDLGDEGAVQWFWMFHNESWVWGFTLQDGTLYGLYSRDKGQSWETAVAILEGVDLVGLISNDDNSVVWGYGRSGGNPCRVVLKRSWPEGAEGTAMMVWERDQQAIDTTHLPEPPDWDAAPFAITRPHGFTGTAYVWVKTDSTLDCYLTEDYFLKWTKVPPPAMPEGGNGG